MEFTQLYPEQRRAALDELLEQVRPVPAQARDRPYVLVNFVSSADGRATIGGRSGPLSSDGDKAMFHGLRECVDAVLAGTGTMATECYGRIIKDPDRRRARVERGLAAEPLAALVTRSQALPPDIPLLFDPEARVVAFGPVGLRTDATGPVQLVELDPAELTLTTVMRRLRSDHDVRLLLCEGGPTLFSALLHERLVDELFLTIAPVLTGGGRGPTITSGTELVEPARLGLRWVLEREESLFLRYAVR